MEAIVFPLRLDFRSGQRSDLNPWLLEASTHVQSGFDVPGRSARPQRQTRGWPETMPALRIAQQSWGAFRFKPVRIQRLRKSKEGKLPKGVKQ